MRRDPRETEQAAFDRPVSRVLGALVVLDVEVQDVEGTRLEYDTADEALNLWHVEPLPRPFRARPG
jgi:hypothetical protein